MMPSSKKVGSIQVIELHMVEKSKYFPLTALSGFVIRGVLYPFSLIKTRLQVQRHNALYKGTWDAFKKIAHADGMRGLYKGFWISNLMVVSQMSYISTYEGVRHYLANHTTFTDNRIRSFIAGGCASMVGQTTIVPIDVVSQHLQMLGKKDLVEKSQRLILPADAANSRFGPARAIVAAVYKRDGFAGFYRGYLASLTVYAPNSAMWWFFYDIYCELLAEFSPVFVPRLVLQCIAAPMGGATTTLITTPMDAIRARIQVENTYFMETARSLADQKKSQLKLSNQDEGFRYRSFRRRRRQGRG